MQGCSGRGAACVFPFAEGKKFAANSHQFRRLSRLVRKSGWKLGSSIRAFLVQFILKSLKTTWLQVASLWIGPESKLRDLNLDKTRSMFTSACRKVAENADAVDNAESLHAETRLCASFNMGTSDLAGKTRFPIVLYRFEKIDQALFTGESIMFDKQTLQLSVTARCTSSVRTPGYC